MERGREQPEPFFLISQLTSMTVGWTGSSNTVSATGYRAITNADLLLNEPGYIFTFLNTAVNGYAVFPTLVHFSDLSTADLVISDQSNNAGDDGLDFEVLIRKCYTAGQRLIYILNPVWTALTNDQINTPSNLAALTEQLAICEHYGITYIDGWQIAKDYVNGGGDLTDIFTDVNHWTVAGHTLVSNALLPYLPTGGTIPTPSSYYNANAADMEESPVVTVGTGNDSTTGTWATAGTSVSSTDVGATITFSGTFRKFGIYNASINYPTCTAVIDGGDPIPNFYAYPNGYDIGTRGAHTVVLTVTSELEIDEFWAI